MNDACLFHHKEHKHKKSECHCDCHLRSRSSSYKSNLQITVQRNFANMMNSELTEGASLDMDQNEEHSHKYEEHSHKYEELISSAAGCHRLGPEFDLNSTFIRYRYMIDRDIPAMMTASRTTRTAWTGGTSSSRSSTSRTRATARA